jgi:acyl-coenzyme A synthetase/AMP-(fatty) acid ligase
MGGNGGIMLLSDWYAHWKEKRIQAAVEEARAKAYEEGYAAGKSGTPNRTGDTVAHGRKGDVVKTTGQKK